MRAFFYGLFAKPLSYIVPIKKNSWVLGSDYGNQYREGSKSLLEYMVKNHPEYDCVFITQNLKVKNELASKKIPCLMNNSIKGIWKVLRAEVVFTTQAAADIQLVYKKRQRKYIFLSHGQPYKVAFQALPKHYWDALRPNTKTSVKQRIIQFFTKGYHYTESVFFTSTSDFLIPYNKLYYGINANVRVLGMPRNDILFNEEKIKREKWLPGVNGMFVITYMPTHRNYGEGEASPIPFANNLVVQEWLENNNAILLVKQHPNMEKKSTMPSMPNCIMDITHSCIDPQTLLYYSNILITDYSSVWIDYLLLQRPILFYFYDNYEKNDAGVLYDIREDPPGHLCKTEEELFELIKKCKKNFNIMKPSDRIVSKYHKYVDDNSCERYFEAIVYKDR